MCTLDGLSCIRITGSGSLADPYVLEVVIDPDVQNVLECRENGLFADTGATVFTDSTPCIDLSGIGSMGDPIVASPVIDPDVANLLDCGATGLLATLNIDDTTTVDLEGAGTAGDPLTAEVLFDPAPDNTAHDDGTGVYVSSHDFRYIGSRIDTTDSPYVADYNHAIVVDKSAGDVGITLPGIGGFSSDGSSILVRVLSLGGAFTCGIFPTGGATVNGFATITIPDGEGVQLVAVNGDWYTFTERD